MRKTIGLCAMMGWAAMAQAPTAAAPAIPPWERMVSVLFQLEAKARDVRTENVAVPMRTAAATPGVAAWSPGDWTKAAPVLRKFRQDYDALLVAGRTPEAQTDVQVKARYRQRRQLIDNAVRDLQAAVGGTAWAAVDEHLSAHFVGAAAPTKKP